MPKGCCGGANCSCKIETTGLLEATGSGQANDPFVLSVEAEFVSAHNKSFDTTATGTGTSVEPWEVETTWAPTAQLDDLPDVDVQGPTNGQVLAWNSTTSKWSPAAPTTAASGAVQHDGTLVGDGSVAIPLGVVPISSRLLSGFVSGIGLSDTGMAAVVQHFATSAERTATILSPVINQLSMLDTSPGVIQYWTGAAWATLPGNFGLSLSGQLLALSGSYAGTQVTVMTRQISVTTDTNAQFDVLSASDLVGRSGVISCQVQEVGTGTPWKCVVFPNTTKISGTAYRLSDGTPNVGAPITATVHALVY